MNKRENTQMIHFGKEKRRIDLEIFKIENYTTINICICEHK